MNIILCGLPGSGKTAVGKILATQLKRTFHDIDRLIEAHDGRQCTCREIFQRKGESYFRQLEQEVVATLTLDSSVIATGGSTPLVSQNVRHLQSLGTLIYLRANPDDLLPRILQTGLPPYLDPDQPALSFQQLATTRHPLYLQACKVIVDTQGLNPEEICKKIRRVI